MLFIASFGLTLLATLACRPLAKWTNMMSHPNPIVAQHIKATPYLGGLAVAFGAAAGFVATAGIILLSGPDGKTATSLHGPGPLLLHGGFAFLLLGLLDDAVVLKPFIKLGSQAAIAVVLLGLAWGIDGTSGTVLSLALGTLWIVGMVNAVNLTDVCDGLVSVLSSIALITIALTGGPASDWAVALLGASAGFLVFNFPPASIFLGDAGSHFFGFTLAVMTMPIGLPGIDHLSIGQLVFGPVLLAVFIFETIFVTKMRANKGLKWYRGSPDHCALRMQAAGYSKTKTVAIAGCVAAMCGITAAVWLGTPPGLLAGSLSCALILLFGSAWRWLRAHEVPPKTGGGL